MCCRTSTFGRQSNRVACFENSYEMSTDSAAKKMQVQGLPWDVETPLVRYKSSCSPGTFSHSALCQIIQRSLQLNSSASPKLSINFEP